MSMLSLVKHIIYSSIKNLFGNHSFEFTYKTYMTEWNLAHHLANELSKYIFWLDHDFDLIKPYSENKRPDIIFHKRGIHELNFLIIELKRTDDVKYDIKKIREHWMGELYHRFGASIVIKGKTDWYGKIFEAGKEQIIEFKNQENIGYLPLPSNETLEYKTEIERIVSKIYHIAKSRDFEKNLHLQKQVEELIQKLDELVLELYYPKVGKKAIVEGKNEVF